MPREGGNFCLFWRFVVLTRLREGVKCCCLLVKTGAFSVY